MSLRPVPAEVLQLPTREPEAYLTRRELASELRIGLTTLDKLVKEGLPSERWGLRTRRFQRSRVVAWLRERERRLESEERAA